LTFKCFFDILFTLNKTAYDNKENKRQGLWLRYIYLIYQEQHKNFAKIYFKITKEKKDLSFFGEEGESEAFVACGGNKILVFLVDELQKISTIVHECLHVTNAVLSRAGLRLNSKTEEAYAYYLGFIFTEIFQIWSGAKEHRLKNNFLMQERTKELAKFSKKDKKDTQKTC